MCWWHCRRSLAQFMFHETIFESGKTFWSVRALKPECFWKRSVLPPASYGHHAVYFHYWAREVVRMADRGKMVVKRWDKYDRVITSHQQWQNGCDGIGAAIKRCGEFAMERVFQLTPDDVNELPGDDLRIEKPCPQSQVHSSTSSICLIGTMVSRYAKNYTLMVIAMALLGMQHSHRKACYP